ncbi:hypothetical protein LEP1GSC188_3344 [Leptospira weilii serovar Topaz str. LT2116]|uniref:Uncharacterized protein n=1 Tax=Leptospira weilii serovar Topaz str. LT2116 TaxID=1088540 RepID=M3H0E3_9LEPT|nr:hypothetical protein LEP1GSC188_3344 [Leptospira weilii serovar Topaz str. LT2116]
MGFFDNSNVKKSVKPFLMKKTKIDWPKEFEYFSKSGLLSSLKYCKTNWFSCFVVNAGI